MKGFVKRGEVYYADFDPTVGSEQGGVRPLLIIQNDVGNKYSPTTVVVRRFVIRKVAIELSTHRYDPWKSPYLV